MYPASLGRPHYVKLISFISNKPRWITSTTNRSMSEKLEGNIPPENTPTPERSRPPEMMTREEFIDSEKANHPLQSEEWVEHQFKDVSTGKPGLSIESPEVMQHPEWSENYKRLVSPNKIVIRDNNGEPIAITTLQNIGEEKFVGVTAVKPQFRRQGLAIQLYEKAAEMGYRDVSLANVGSAGARHKLYVKEAISKGKPVYEGWQKDYPDLVEKYNNTKNLTGNSKGA